MQATCTNLNGQKEWHSQNLEDHLENLVGFVSSHHLTFGELTDSVGRGCRICQSLWEDLSEYERDSMRDSDTTAENKGLTEMEIRYTTGYGYEINIRVKNTRRLSCAYGLKPGQCLS
jgi:hypothetical protein